MLAYAANTPKAAGRAGSTKALTLVIAGHAALLAAVLTARMDGVGPIVDEIPDIINIRPQPAPPPPPPTDQREQEQPDTQQPFIDSPPPKVDMEQATPFELDAGATIRDIVIGSGPTVLDPPRHVPVKVGPRLATSDSALKPPYPPEKIRLEQEATLRLRLTIDARGRVTAVDPVGTVDPVFLEAARRHIVRAWRYKPATEDGVAVTTTTVISLSFRLEDV